MDAQGWVGRFEFEALPRKRVEVRGVSGTGFLVEGPSSIDLGAEESLELLIRDDVERIAVGFEPIDFATGEPVASFDICITHDGWIEFMELEEMLPSERVRALPRDRAFEWVLFARGYMPQPGRYEPTRRAGEEIVFRPSLRRGWGVSVTVYPEEARSGLRFHSDGNPIPLLEHANLPLLMAPVRPQRLFVENPGWELAVDGGGLRADGSFDDRTKWLGVYLQPEGR